MTVQKKQLAKGTKIYVGVGVTTPTLFGRIETVNLPKQDYETVEAPELYPVDDSGSPISNDPVELGDEIMGEFDFTHYYEPLHADADKLDDAWAAKSECTFWADCPHGGRVTFKGKIKTLAPATLAKKDYFKRVVTVIRTSAITIAAIPA
jgi:hypothetical protein